MARQEMRRPGITTSFTGIRDVYPGIVQIKPAAFISFIVFLSAGGSIYGSYDLRVLATVQPFFRSETQREIWTVGRFTHPHRI
ncbi:hypothetical protein K445DRAFT_319830 [Daldinia sp. EC12]|nr:hypothetical protein K445DRAFT_319830 [Daldinia sp. EC12]